MINRDLIRSKVLQTVYAHQMNEAQSLESAEKEFRKSLDQSYELYHLLLLLIPAITDHAEERIEMGRNKYLPTEEEKNPNTRFIDNSFVSQLRVNSELRQAVDKFKLSWTVREEHSKKQNDFRPHPIIKTLYEQIAGSPFYDEYMTAGSCTYEDDKEIWRKIFRQIIARGTELEEALEERSIYWNDDIDIVCTFVTKTIKQFEAENGADQALLPQYREDDDLDFALKLLKAALQHGQEYRDLITGAIQNWELDRLALMDLLIMQTALAEIIEIPDIPVSVSLNEYINLAKIYSTEKSSVFINGTLDAIVKRLRSENRLFKS